jgi:hypothetical protein
VAVLRCGTIKTVFSDLSILANVVVNQPLLEFYHRHLPEFQYPKYYRHYQVQDFQSGRLTHQNSSDCLIRLKLGDVLASKNDVMPHFEKHQYFEVLRNWKLEHLL